MQPEERRAAILATLATSHVRTVRQLAADLAVHPMTIRRDIDLLAADGLAVRAHGSVRRPPERAAAGCAVCGAPPGRWAWRLVDPVSPSAAGGFCCGHCARLYLRTHPTTPILAVDPLWGHVGDVRDGWLVEGSSVGPCCRPAVQWFSLEDTARRFSAAFGGTVVPGAGP